MTLKTTTNAYANAKLPVGYVDDLYMAEAVNAWLEGASIVQVKVSSLLLFVS